MINGGFIPKSVTTDEVTITSTAGTISVKDGGITGAKIGFYPTSLFFGDSSDGAGTGNITISTAIKQYSSLTINNGETLAFSGLGKYIVYVAGNLSISGAVTISDRAGNVPTTYDAGTATTTGGTAILKIGVYSLDMPAEASSGLGGGALNAGGGGGGSYGAGGSGGASNNSGGYGCGTAGAGKATVWFIVKGTVTFGATATIAGAGGTGGNGGTFSGGNYGSGGGGGGGGANIRIFSIGNVTIAAGATGTLNGGAAGNGGDGVSGGGGGGGGGAGGSWIVTTAGTYTNSGTITAAGGALGTQGGHSAVNGTAGAAGLVV